MSSKSNDKFDNRNVKARKFRRTLAKLSRGQLETIVEVEEAESEENCEAACVDSMDDLHLSLGSYSTSSEPELTPRRTVRKTQPIFGGNRSQEINEDNECIKHWTIAFKWKRRAKAGPNAMQHQSKEASSVRFEAKTSDMPKLLQQYLRDCERCSTALKALESYYAVSQQMFDFTKTTKPYSRRCPDCGVEFEAVVGDVAFPEEDAGPGLEPRGTRSRETPRTSEILGPMPESEAPTSILSDRWVLPMPRAFVLPRAVVGPSRNEMSKAMAEPRTVPSSESLTGLSIKGKQRITDWSRANISSGVATGPSGIGKRGISGWPRATTPQEAAVESKPFSISKAAASPSITGKQETNAGPRAIISSGARGGPKAFTVFEAAAGQSGEGNRGNSTGPTAITSSGEVAGPEAFAIFEAAASPSITGKQETNAGPRAITSSEAVAGSSGIGNRATSVGPRAITLSVGKQWMSPGPSGETTRTSDVASLRRGSLSRSGADTSVLRNQWIAGAPRAFALPSGAAGPSSIRKWETTAGPRSGTIPRTVAGASRKETPRASAEPKPFATFGEGPGASGLGKRRISPRPSGIANIWTTVQATIKPKPKAGAKGEAKSEAKTGLGRSTRLAGGYYAAFTLGSNRDSEHDDYTDI